MPYILIDCYAKRATICFLDFIFEDSRRVRWRYARETGFHVVARIVRELGQPNDAGVPVFGAY